MFERELVLNGLKRQNSILEQLLGDIESSGREILDFGFYRKRVRLLESNLRKLRQIRQNYDLVQGN